MWYVAARLFDPLGILEPFTVRAKVMMQEPWIMKIVCDDEIPDPQNELGLQRFKK